MSTPQGDPSATPGSNLPVTGQQPLSGATPGNVSADSAKELEAARQQIANHTEELDRLRKFKATAEKAQQEAETAKLGDIEKAAKRAEVAENQVKQYRDQLAAAHVKLAAQALGIIDPEIAALAIQSKLEFDSETGLPTNTDALLKDLLKAKPYLGKPADPTASPPASPAQTNGAPSLPAMNPGRSSINAPGTNATPGKIPTLRDVFTRSQ